MYLHNENAVTWKYVEIRRMQKLGGEKLGGDYYIYIRKLVEIRALDPIKRENFRIKHKLTCSQTSCFTSADDH